MPVFDPIRANVSNKTKDYPVVPEGFYVAQVMDIDFKPKEEQEQKGKFAPKDKFYVRLGILSPEQRGARLTHFVSTAFTSGFDGGQASKLYELVCAVMGEKVDENQELDINTLIGGRLRILVKHKEVGGKTYQNIAEVMKATSQDKQLEELDTVSSSEVDKLDLSGALE